ncbi:LuxR C-terminal-related transcriptional regulator [Algibacter sp. 2305UL17-15]|uniref:LuxR C-terminal-related transcriptional regulator n=1 Tax=Algibacter sp. 2305UL17-15 TaxID=3231268 RepID=UPI003458C1BE
MKQDGVKKVKNVWNTKNKIENPNIKENLLELVEQTARWFLPGEFYYFVFNFDMLEMQMVSDDVKSVLGIAPELFSLEYLFKELMHPEDIEKIHEKETVGFDFLLNHIPKEDIPLYKVVYLLRLKHVNGQYKMMLHQSRTINVSKDGKVQQILCIQSDLTHLNLPMDHRMSFLSSKKPSYYSVKTAGVHKFIENHCIDDYTKREKQILKEIANGKTNNEIAIILNISPHTINTHRKNILKKSECKNMAEIITKCIREGII